jgi:hypothetical protein
MSKCQRETQALSARVPFDESARRQELEQEIAQIQRNARCVQRAAGLMTGLTALAVAGLGYPSILLEHFPYRVPPFIMHLIYALSAGSLISLFVFAGLGRLYRKKLDRRKDACRPLADRQVEYTVSQPERASLSSMPESGAGHRTEGTA